jgi:hypothetical protein
MANLLSKNILYTTIAIEDDVGAPAGSGFLVADTLPSRSEHGQNVPTWERPKTRAYLVTAAHVLGNKFFGSECH